MKKQNLIQICNNRLKYLIKEILNAIKKTYFHSYARFNGNENWKENAIFIEIKNHQVCCFILSFHSLQYKTKEKLKYKKPCVCMLLGEDLGRR